MPAGAHRVPRTLTLVFWTAVAVSIVHYADNAANYADYPQSASLPNPTPAATLVAWLAFTATGLAGYALVRRSSRVLGPLLLAAYSGSGIIGIGHYLVPGATDMPWWRQAHVVADIASGLAVLVVAVRLARARDRAPTPTT